LFNLLKTKFYLKVAFHACLFFNLSRNYLWPSFISLLIHVNLSKFDSIKTFMNRLPFSFMALVHLQVWTSCRGRSVLRDYFLRFAIHQLRQQVWDSNHQVAAWCVELRLHPLQRWICDPTIKALKLQATVVFVFVQWSVTALASVKSSTNKLSLAWLIGAAENFHRLLWQLVPQKTLCAAKGFCPHCWE